MDEIKKSTKADTNKPNILVGELRGIEAIDLLKKWSNGRPSGKCSVMANTLDNDGEIL